MDIYAYLAIFLSPIIGLIIFDNKYNSKIKEILLIYFAILIVSNILTCTIIYYSKSYIYLYFTLSFFIKYSICNIFTSIFVSIIAIVLKDNFRIHFISKENEKK